MRILYLNTTYSGGGAEKVTRQVYEGMKARGHEVYEIVCYNRRGAVEDDHVKVLYTSAPEKLFHRLQTHNRGNTNRTIPYAVWYICNLLKSIRSRWYIFITPMTAFWESGISGLFRCFVR